MNDPNWKPFDLAGLRQRLVDVKSLLEQAAAVGMAHDVERLDAIAEAERVRKTEASGTNGRRRYR
ncbi:MAG TPA: hypothetical protein VMG12_20390 [Polyangiaceae bacterium]|nr:hypothetical protein [Polyangiaceae bacterium]